MQYCSSSTNAHAPSSRVVAFAYATPTLPFTTRTAHTTAADSLWAGGAPWLALAPDGILGADRMDSLLSHAVMHSAGTLPLVTGTLRAFEDEAVALVRK